MSLFNKITQVVELIDPKTKKPVEIAEDKPYLIILTDPGEWKEEDDYFAEKQCIKIRGRQALYDYLLETMGSYDLLHSYVLSGGLKLGQECSIYTFLRLSLQKKNVDTNWLNLDELNEYARNGNEDIENLDLLYTSELNRPV